MPLHFRTYPIPRRLLLACLASALAPAAIHAADERRDEEALFFRTLESQGGRSHASGERPDLGPVLTRPELTEPPPATFRVGLTPTAFNTDGTVLREYDTGPAHNHASVSLDRDGALRAVRARVGQRGLHGCGGRRRRVREVGWR